MSLPMPVTYEEALHKWKEETMFTSFQATEKNRSKPLNYYLVLIHPNYQGITWFNYIKVNG